jgi:hypothetical protein
MGKEEGGDFRDCGRILMETQEFSDLRLTPFQEFDISTGTQTSCWPP